MRIELESVLHEMNALIANLTRLRVYAQHNANVTKDKDTYTRGFFEGKQEGLRIATRRAIEVMERIEPEKAEDIKTTHTVYDGYGNYVTKEITRND